MHFTSSCFCNSWLNNCILWNCLFFNKFNQDILNCFWILNNFYVISCLSLNAWNWIYCELSFNWLLRLRLRYRLFWLFCWFVINDGHLTLWTLCNCKCLFSFSSFSNNFIACSYCVWSLLYFNNLLSSNVWNWFNIINLLNYFLNLGLSVLTFRNLNFWFWNRCNNWLRLLFNLSNYYRFIIFL